MDLPTLLAPARAPRTAAPDDDVLRALAEGRHAPDWERLIEQGTQPALVIGGERRTQAR